PLSSGFASNRAIVERRPIHIPDLRAMEAAEISGPSHEAAVSSGIRALLAVPLLREGDAIGALVIRRREAQPLTATQIALLQTFAHPQGGGPMGLLFDSGAVLSRRGAGGGAGADHSARRDRSRAGEPRETLASEPSAHGLLLARSYWTVTVSA